MTNENDKPDDKLRRTGPVYDRLKMRETLDFAMVGAPGLEPGTR